MPSRIILLVAVAGAIVTARIGIGTAMLFTYIGLPLLLLTLSRFGLLSSRSGATVLIQRLPRIWRPSVLLLVASAAAAFVMPWVPGIDWFDLAIFPEPAFAAPTLANVVTLRPLASLESYAGRSVVALYYIWTAWNAVHLCLAWRTEWQARRDSAIELVVLLLLCLAVIPQGVVLLMLGANLSEPELLTGGEMAFSMAVAAILFTAGMFFGRYANYSLARLVRLIGRRMSVPE